MARSEQELRLTGLAYASLGRHDDAAESYGRAARREPNPEVLFRLADAEFQAGRPDRAREAAAQALALDPRHQQLGQAQLFGGSLLLHRRIGFGFCTFRRRGRGDGCAGHRGWCRRVFA